jgi:hypothetical protein
MKDLHILRRLLTAATIPFETEKDMVSRANATSWSADVPFAGDSDKRY